MMINVHIQKGSTFSHGKHLQVYNCMVSWYSICSHKVQQVVKINSLLDRKYKTIFKSSDRPFILLPHNQNRVGGSVFGNIGVCVYYCK